MRKFLDDNFLLYNSVAEELYHDYAKAMPIIDYHCHLRQKDILNNRRFEDLTEAWLEGDHYKWRAMRTNGVDEKYITGNTPSKEKFMKWAETVPDTVRNPLYHWTHLELQRYFDIDELLNASSAERIFENASAQLKTGELSCRGMLEKMNVNIVCTTDDPTDDLAYHIQLKEDYPEIKVLPGFRPDNAYNFDHFENYRAYIDTLGDLAHVKITSYDTLLEALSVRIDFFHSVGCRLSDHGIEYIPSAIPSTNPEDIYKQILEGKNPGQEKTDALKHSLLIELCKLYAAKGWAQQFHLGALRNNNSRMMRMLGPDTGFDSIGDFSQAKALSVFLNRLDRTNELAKTIIYNLNPSDNEVMATMIGNFNDGSVAGKMQFGTGWWFLDQKDGMERQINALSNMGLLSRFVGMLTDSRSFLSFPRHEYFRRLLCNLIGTDVVNGELPHDMDLLGSMVKDICYTNAEKYFEF